MTLTLTETDKKYEKYTNEKESEIVKYKNEIEIIKNKLIFKLNEKNKIKRN